MLAPSGVILATCRLLMLATMERESFFNSFAMLLGVATAGKLTGEAHIANKIRNLDLLNYMYEFLTTKGSLFLMIARNTTQAVLEGNSTRHFDSGAFATGK